MSGTAPNPPRCRRRRTVLTMLVAVVAASCGGGDDAVSSGTVAPAPSGGSAITTITPVTEQPGSAAVTAPTTSTSPTVTAAAPLTTEPATTTPATTDSVAALPLDGPATAFVTANDQLVEIDVASGATLRVLDEAFSGDGTFRGGLRLSPDRRTLWFDEGYEDGWFDCQSARGAFGSVDVETGEMQLLGTGFGVSPSPDGASIAYVASEVCLPDPANPEVYVFTPADRVVVRDLATGDERVFVTDTPPDADRSPSIVRATVFGPTGSVFVAVVDGRVFEIDVDGPAVIQEHPVVLDGFTGALVAATDAGLVSIEAGDEGSNDLYLVDPTSGDASLLASSELYMPVGVSGDGDIAVSSADPVTVTPGAAVAVIVPPDDPFVYDVDW